MDERRDALGRKGQRLAALADAAERAGAEHVAREARDLHARLAEGRFHVACVGQFKRGKSSLLNALAGESVLPVGVVPVTAVITLLRYGADRRARVRFDSGETREVDPGSVASFVTERENPDNVKGVAAVEVEVPSELLRTGMCLVDTPGLGSVFAHNTETTRAFVPHLDAALVVVGADPPISGEELALVEDAARQVERIVVVLNKADRLTDEERRDGRAFAEETLRRRLGRTVGPVLEVSALERLRGEPTRDWTRLEATLKELGDDARAMLEQAEERGVRRIGAALLGQIDEQRDALERPEEESERRVEALRRATADAGRTLDELDYRFRAVEDGLARTLDAEREGFLRDAAAAARTELDRRIDAAAGRGDLARWSMSAAQDVARGAIEDWRGRLAPRAERLYGEAMQRFVEIGNEFLRHVGDSTDPALARLPRAFAPDVAFRTKAHFYFTNMLTIASPTLGARLASVTRGGRSTAVHRDAGEYLARLLETNAARAANDLLDQVRESRRRVQAELRDKLRDVVTSASDAMARAAARRREGEPAVQEARETWRQVREDVLRAMSEAPEP